jgi:hypothetical protein
MTETTNIELRIAIMRRFRSQARASRPLRIKEARLSRLVNGYSEPTAAERERLSAALGGDYFGSDGEHHAE